MIAHLLFPYFLEKRLAIHGFQLLVNVFSVILIDSHFFGRVFSEYTEAIAISLIPLYIILPEIYAFIIGFSCTVWTKTTSLACSLADGVLADAILISPHPCFFS